MKKRKAEIHKTKSRKRKEKNLDQARKVMKRALHAKQKERKKKVVEHKKARRQKKLEHKKAIHQKKIERKQAREHHKRERQRRRAQIKTPAPKSRALAQEQQQQIDEISKAIKEVSKPEVKKWSLFKKKPEETQKSPPAKVLDPMQEAIYTTMKSIANLKLDEAKQNYLDALAIYNKLSDKEKERYYEDLNSLYEDRKHAEKAFKS